MSASARLLAAGGLALLGVLFRPSAEVSQPPVTGAGPPCAVCPEEGWSGPALVIAFLLGGSTVLVLVVCGACCGLALGLWFRPGSCAGTRILPVGAKERLTRDLLTWSRSGPCPPIPPRDASP